MPNKQLLLPPLSLYIHIPWCVEKCPYCDFNSHKVRSEIPKEQYIQMLIKDLTQDLSLVQGRKIHSIFIGGGTPSLFEDKYFYQLLSQIKQLIEFEDNIEISIESNPNSAEQQRFQGFVDAGINRISIGIQSFDNDKLNALGRVHNNKEALNAINFAQLILNNKPPKTRLNSFNIDLMHGLPQQSSVDALADLRQAIELDPPHLSWYQLTIEPNTMFYKKPPTLPDEEILWDIFTQGHQILTNAGYIQYETSAYAKAGFQCKHNLNYWNFGDYLAIGCGAHGKITQGDKILRFSKTKHPKGYLAGNFLQQQEFIQGKDLAFEFFLNRFRLTAPCSFTQFENSTGLSLSSIEKSIDIALKKGLLKIITATDFNEFSEKNIKNNHNLNYWQVTHKGRLFLNDLLTLFL